MCSLVTYWTEIIKQCRYKPVESRAGPQAPFPCREYLARLLRKTQRPRNVTTGTLIKCCHCQSTSTFIKSIYLPWERGHPSTLLPVYPPIYSHSAVPVVMPGPMPTCGESEKGALLWGPLPPTLPHQRGRPKMIIRVQWWQCPETGTLGCFWSALASWTSRPDSTLHEFRPTALLHSSSNIL